MRLSLAVLLLLAGCSGPHVVFLGDSLTAGLRVQSVTPNAENRGVSGIDTADLLRALPSQSFEGVSLVVLTIGTNDVHKGREAGLESRLQEIARRVPGPVLWNAIPPNAHHDVTQANALIEKTCAARPACTFYRTDFQAGDFKPDGVHLSRRGYIRWVESLRQRVAATVR